MFMLIKNRFIFGIDDSTGVVNCIYWPDRKDRDSQQLEYFFKTSMKVGSQVSVVGQLEYYNGDIQINVHKVCLLSDQKHDVFNELGQTFDAQKGFFDPMTAHTPDEHLKSIAGIDISQAQYPAIQDVNHSQFPAIYERIAREVAACNRTRPAPMETDEKVDTFKEDRKGLSKMMCDEEKFIHSAEFANEMTSDQLIEYDQEKAQKQVISQILKNIDAIFPDTNKNKTADGQPCADFTKSGFLNHKLTKEIVNKQIQMHFEGKALEVETDQILFSIISEFEREKYFQTFDDPEREDDLVFVDRRQSFYEFLVQTIKDNDSGLGFETICKRVVEDGKFTLYNKDYIHECLDLLFKEGLISEPQRQLYVAY